MKVTIECEPEQVQLIIDCLEESFRFRMKQGNNFLDKILLEQYPKNHEQHEKWYKMREDAEAVCKALIDIIYCTTSIELPESTHNISDMWSCLRHALYMVDHDGTDYMDVRSDNPIKLGEFSLPKVSVEK